MTASTSMSFFHQWLLADPAKTSSACAIVLHIPDSRPADWLIQEITTYLNEYDDDGEGRWLPATPELVFNVANNPNHRRLLGMSDGQEEEFQGSTQELQKTLQALGKRGHVVLSAGSTRDDTLGASNAFHAGVGTAEEIPQRCHIILNPELIGQRCIAPIIGDVFLEWLLCETKRGSFIRDIR